MLYSDDNFNPNNDDDINWAINYVNEYLERTE